MVPLARMSAHRGLLWSQDGHLGNGLRLLRDANVSHSFTSSQQLLLRMFFLLRLKPLFPGNNELDQLNKIHNVLGTPSCKVISKLSVHKSENCQQFPKQAGTGLLPLLTNISSDGQDIMKQMLVYDPDARCNVKRLLEHRYFVNYREHSDKVLQRRVSFTEPTHKGSHVGGDWRASTHKAVIGQRRNDKYITNVNRASQNNVMDVKRYGIPTQIGKRQEPERTNDTTSSGVSGQLKSTSLQGYVRYVGSVADKDKGSMRDMFRKTTSNIPQLINRSTAHASFVTKAGGAPLLKSTLALPRIRDPAPLGGSTSAALTSTTSSKGHDLKLPKPPKILILDSTLKSISKTTQINRSRK